MMPIINKIYSLEEKEYYIYIPGTTHYDEDRFGNPIYVKDYYYLDDKFNKFIGQFSKENAKEYADRLIDEGRDVLVGDHAPLIETRYGTFEQFSNPEIKGIWERPSEEQLLKYKDIIANQEQGNKPVKKLA